MPLRQSILASALLTLSVIAFGCDTGGVGPPEGSPFYADQVNCDDGNGDSPTDMACTEDCTRACGYLRTDSDPRAQKYCVCEGGVFIECRCPKPDWYLGAPSAPYCDDLTPDGSGKKSFLDKMPCQVQWQECIARDPVDGFTPQGCACMDRGDKKPGTNPPEPLFKWDCRSTEKWFYPEQ
jgi:hypothetical protein